MMFVLGVIEGLVKRGRLRWIFLSKLTQRKHTGY